MSAQTVKLRAPTVTTLHAKGFPDHRIASKLRMPLGDVVRRRQELQLRAHPPGSRLTIEQVHAVIEKWEKYIWSVARRWGKAYPDLDIDDLHSECIAGCLRAGEKYDPRKLNPKTGKPYIFTTYADHWMRNFLQKFLTRERKRGFSGGAPLADSTPVMSFHDIAHADDRNTWEPEAEPVDLLREKIRGDSSWWARRLSCLDYHEATIVMHRYRFGYSWEQMESLYNDTQREYCDKWRALTIKDYRRILAAAIEKLKAAGDMD